MSLDLDEAADALAGGLVVVLPTDTVYGLASTLDATMRLFAVKRRPHDVAIPVLVADEAQALDVVVPTPVARRLMARWWPGALTIVLPRQPGLLADLGGRDDDVGVRCPDHPVPRELAARAGPLAVTSANRHGEPTPPTAAEVAATFGEEVAVVVDGGRCEGAPSTVVRCTDDDVHLLREGRIPFANLVSP